MATDDLKSLFDAFYERLVLRDFLGKVIPGLVLLSTVCASVTWINLTSIEFSNQVNILIELSFVGWLAIFGVAWLIAFAVQSFGEWCPYPWSKCRKHLIDYYPRHVFPDDESYYRFGRKFEERATPKDRIGAERLKVIMEACGNGYVSLIISLLFMVFYCLYHLFFFGEVLTYGFKIMGPVLLLAVFLLLCLRRMHCVHIERLYKYMKVVAEN